MDASETIRTILQSQWPDECEIVDRATVERIVTVVSENQTFDEAFRSVHGGADWDVVQIIKLLVEASAFIKTSLEIWQLLGKQLGRRPSTLEFREALATKEVLAPEAVREKLDGIAAELAKASF